MSDTGNTHDPSATVPRVASAGLLLQEFGIVLLAAGVAAVLFHRLKQPVILGYLLAGFIVGPFSPGPTFINDTEVMSFLGELGIVFLLFALGLEFNLKKLRKVGATAALAGVLEISVMLWIGHMLGRAFGWSTLESLFLGSIMAISSTTIIVKVLESSGHKHEDWAQVAFGILIIEDILAVLILTGLSSASATGNFQPEMMGGLAIKLLIFLGTVLVVGLMFAPRFVEYLAGLRTPEILVVAGAGAAFGMALLAGSLGFSAGLGAFIAGALMAESPRASLIEHGIAPLRDVFTAIFFVTIGALVDPVILRGEWLLIIAVAVGVIVGKTIGVSTAAFVAGVPPTKALRVGMTMAQIGEFSFVIAALGASLAVTSPGLLPAAVAVSTITAFTTPYFVRYSPTVVEKLAKHVPSGVHAYARFYQGWIGRLRRSDRASPEWGIVRKNAVRAGLYAIVIVGLFAAGVGFVDDLANVYALGGARLTRLASWIALSIIAAPFVVAWYGAMRRLIDALARAAVPQRLRQAHPTSAERLLRNTFTFLAVLIAGFATLAIASPFVAPSFVILVVLVGIAISTAFLGNSLRTFHRQVEDTVAHMFEGDSAPETREEALRIVSGSEAWGASSREIRLPEISGGTGRTLAQLRLRALTGASVVSIRGVGQPTYNPRADHRLAAGDHVVVVGDEEALLRAAEILLGQDVGIAGGATEITIVATSPLVGQTLVEANLESRTGADVLVVRRGGAPHAAVADFVFAANDILVVSGTDDEVAKVTRIAGKATSH